MELAGVLVEHGPLPRRLRRLIEPALEHRGSGEHWQLGHGRGHRIEGQAARGRQDRRHRNAVASDEFAAHLGKRAPTKDEWNDHVAPLLAAGRLHAAPEVMERVVWDGEPYLASLPGTRPTFRRLLGVNQSQRGVRLVRTPDGE